MKTFEGQNFYEILKIPFNADANEIDRAYRAALDIYEEDSLVTYTLFSDEQRSDLLQAIDEAFHTLTHDEQRVAYNQMLIDTGQAGAASFVSKTEPAPKQPQKAPVAVPHRDPHAWIKKKSEEKEITQIVHEMMNKELVSGSELNKLREALGIELSEIFALSRISVGILRMIEQNQYSDLPAEIFLKSFLKTYADILQIDPKRTIDGYLKHMALSKGAKNAR